jgi:hypothetical protein
MDTKNQREVVTEALTKAGPEQFEGMCIGWVMVSEWVDTEGKRWLMRLDSNASNEGLASWTRMGYLFDAVFGGGWNEED